jgi:hypothetical protein
VPSAARVAAGTFGFLILIQVFAGPLVDQIYDKNNGRYHNCYHTNWIRCHLSERGQNVCPRGAAFQTPEQTPDGPLPAQVPLP